MDIFRDSHDTLDSVCWRIFGYELNNVFDKLELKLRRIRQVLLFCIVIKAERNSLALGGVVDDVASISLKGEIQRLA